MSDFIFLLLFFLFLLVQVKLEQWSTISTLGFKSHTPEGFLRHPEIYVRVYFVILFAFFVSSLITVAIPVYISLPIVLFAWLSAFAYGKKKGFDDFRAIHHNMLLYGNRYREIPYTKEELSEIDAASNMSNKELLAMLMKFRRWGM